MPPERKTPEERRNEQNMAMAGVFKGYSALTWFPDIVSREIELQSGEKKRFIIFGAFGEEGDTYKPEVLVIMSEDARVRMVAKATWNGNWPEVEGVDTIGGEVTITGAVTGVAGNSLGISPSRKIAHDIPSDELLDVVNKLSLSLRFGETDPHTQENI